MAENPTDDRMFSTLGLEGTGEAIEVLYYTMLLA
jgi:hypothetical protein